MLGFEVSVNGQRLCVAASRCVLSTAVSWSYRVPNRIDFHVGGIPVAGSAEHMDWETPRLAIGDEVTIRIVETDSPDPPDRVYNPRLKPGASEGPA